MSPDELNEVSQTLHRVYAEIVGLKPWVEKHPWLASALTALASHTETVLLGVDESLSKKED